MHITGALVKALMEKREYVRKMFYKREDRKSRCVFSSAQPSDRD